MAINSYEQLCDKNQLNGLSSNVSKVNDNHPSTLEFSNKRSIYSGMYKHGKPDTNRKVTSPYLNGEKVHLISRVTEKRMVHKKTTDFVSSFPLAVNIYKANSGEFNSQKNNKKTKKSVLTLPNEPVPSPQTCTVSDMNDSDYFKVIKCEEKPRPKKKRQLKTNKFRSKDKDTEFYDRDARYCSQLNIDLDSSSTDLFKKITALESFNSKKGNAMPFGKHGVKPHDIWTVLRNVNRFQFQQSPPASQDSLLPCKNKKGNKKRRPFKDTRFIKSCKTEEFAYISSYNLDNSYSQSSLDRVTVIDKQDNISISQEFDNLIEKKTKINKEKKTKSKLRNANKPHIAKDSNNKYVKTKTEQKVISPNYGDSGSSGCGDAQSIISKGQRFQNVNIYLPKVSLEKVNQGPSLQCEVVDSINRDFRDDSSAETAIESNYNKSKVQNVAVVPNNSAKSRLKKAVTYMKNWNQRDIQNEVISIPKTAEQMSTKGNTMYIKEQNNIFTKQINSKPRLLTTIPSTFVAPKVPKIDIRRRLANIKFPLVILGRDQLSSTISVPNYEYPQFLGLDTHIWPFMLGWGKEENIFDTVESFNVTDASIKRKRKSLAERNINTNVNFGGKMSTQNQTGIKSNIALNKSCEEEQKTKPMRLKDKMIKFVSGKNMTRNNLKKDACNGQIRDDSVSIDGVNAETQTYKAKRDNGTDVIVKIASSRYPWARRKWASDFIDNVIKKIKRGAYYNQECKSFDDDNDFGKKNMATQTNDDILPADEALETSFKLEENAARIIPGFDETFSELEVETFSRNQIAVKHCITNVVIKFDIALPEVVNNNITKLKQSITTSPNLVNITKLKQSVICTSSRLTENQGTIFKYKNMLANSILPAELCSILPGMLRRIFDSEKRFCASNLMNNVIHSSLPTLPELANCERFDLQLYLNLPFSTKIANGTFSKKIQTFDIKPINRKKLTSSFKDFLPSTLTKLLPSIDTKILFSNDYIKCVIPNNEIYNTPKTQPKNSVNNPIVNGETRISTALQQYNLSEKAVVPAYKRFSLAKLLQNLNTFSNKLNIHLTIPRAQITVAFLNINFIMTMAQGQVQSPKQSDISESPRKSIYGQNEEKLEICNQTSSNESNYTISNAKNTAEFPMPSKRNKKRNFIKLYRKCNSMSNITKTCTNPVMLSKITTMEEFLQALGMAKTLTTVLNGSTEKKILLSLSKMKSWISYITSSQAFLVLLLCNKKDTANLEMYRPVILQGIAVNRITKVSELDMEIEVIERENINKLTQCEGFTYLPASTENQDALLEELCWIAKNTASDYQKPFDETSERLLRSLLQKRKKLNPSYLRVMARYVGLGLLKSVK